MISRLDDYYDQNGNRITIFSDVEIVQHTDETMLGKVGNVDNYDIIGLTVFIDGVRTKLDYYQVLVVNGR